MNPKAQAQFLRKRERDQQPSVSVPESKSNKIKEINLRIHLLSISIKSLI